MTQKYKYFIGYAVYLICLFSGPHIYSHFHFEAVPLVDMYLTEKAAWESTHTFEELFMTYPEWLSDQDKKDHSIWQEFGYQCAEAFDPWFERPDPCDHTEKGRE